MKHNLVNFTRGSQLLGHFGFMFAAGLKGPLLVTVLVILGLGWWEVQSSLSEQEVYLLWMHLYASAYGFMEFDPAKLVHLKLGDGETAAFPMSVVTQYPPMRAAVAATKDNAAPIKLETENGGVRETYVLNYTGGARYPHLVRDAAKTDYLSEIIKPL